MLPWPSSPRTRGLRSPLCTRPTRHAFRAARPGSNWPFARRTAAGTPGNSIPPPYDKIAAMPCVICGGQPVVVSALTGSTIASGYIEENVQPMCGPCNIDKGRKKAA